MQPIATTNLIVPLTFQFHRKLKLTCKRLQCTMAFFTREALTEKLEKVAAKLREEEALAIADKQPKRGRGLIPLDGFRERESLAPKPLQSLEERRESTGTAADEKTLIEDIYQHHATLIVAALNNPTEKRLRIAEALAAIRNETPITEPPESEILATLEKYVIAVRAKRHPAPTTTASMQPAAETPPPTLTTPGFMSGFAAAMTKTPAPILPPLPVSRFASPMTGKKVTDKKKK